MLWTWLGNRPTWQQLGDGGMAVESRLLGAMLDKAKRDELEGYLSRAEKLAFGNDPSRALALGGIETRMGFAQRSIPLLEQAVEEAQDKELKKRAVFSLFEYVPGYRRLEACRDGFPGRRPAANPEGVVRRVFPDCGTCGKGRRQGRRHAHLEPRRELRPRRNRTGWAVGQCRPARRTHRLLPWQYKKGYSDVRDSGQGAWDVARRDDPGCGGRQVGRARSARPTRAREQQILLEKATRIAIISV